MQPTWFIVIGIAVVMVTRRMSPIAAGFLGILLSLGVGGWGLWSFDNGQPLAMAGYALTKPVFLGMVAAWCGFEIYGLVQAFKKRGEGDGETETD